jgi:hypothetical protein
MPPFVANLVVMPPTFLAEFVGRVVVFVGSPVTPDATEWNDHMEALEAHRKGQPDLRALVWGGGLKLTPRQRMQISRTMPKGARIAVVATGAVDRGIVVAIGWFVHGIRAFAPGHETEAIAHLDVLPSEAATVRSVLWRMRAEMDRGMSRTG